MNSIIAELFTPSGQTGEVSPAYRRAVIAIAHAVLGAALAQFLGGFGLAFALLLAVAYWLAKEWGDLKRGGALWDGVEDALMVSFGAWYGAPEWPLVILCAAGYIMWRASK